MKRLPKSFSLGGNKFTVKTVTPEQMLKLCGGTEAYGLFVPDQCAIYIMVDGRKIKKSVVMQTFWHEFSHALLWSMSHKDYANEKVVDHMGHMLKQLYDTVEH